MLSDVDYDLTCAFVCIMNGIDSDMKVERWANSGKKQSNVVLWQ